MKELARKFWTRQQERGDKPAPIYALVSQGGEQPIGYWKSWSVNKRSMESLRLTEWNPEHWTVERVEPFSV